MTFAVAKHRWVCNQNMKLPPLVRILHYVGMARGHLGDALLSDYLNFKGV